MDTQQIPPLPAVTEMRPKPPSSSPAPIEGRDGRSSFLSLVVNPGFYRCLEHLKTQREIMHFMEDSLREYAVLHEEMGSKLQRLSESPTARFERSLQTTISSFFRSPTTTSASISEIGTTSMAWQTVRDRWTLMGDAYLATATRVTQCANSIAAYLEQSQQATEKVEHWGLKLMDAMNGYIARSEEARETFHSKSRAARMSAKVLEEAEKQAAIGGIARAALLSESRMTKLRDAAVRAKEEELQAGIEYRKALDLVSKKQNELYSVRLPRVFNELQRLVEERTCRIRDELLRFTQECKMLTPGLEESLTAISVMVEQINETTDSKVFVAAVALQDSFPRVYEFIPFDAQSVAPPAAPALPNNPVSGPPPPAEAAHAPLPHAELLSCLANEAQRAKFAHFLRVDEDAADSLIEITLEDEEDGPTPSSSSPNDLGRACFHFVEQVQRFKRPDAFASAAERLLGARAIYEAWMADGAPNKTLQPFFPESIRNHVAQKVDPSQSEAPLSVFDEALNLLLPSLQVIFQDWKASTQQQQQQPTTTTTTTAHNGPAPPRPSSPPPISRPTASGSNSNAASSPSLVLLEKPPADLMEDELLGGSDDELLNRADTLDDLLE